MTLGNRIRKKAGATCGRKIAYAVSRANQQDIGKRFETAVFAELLRRLAGSRVESITSYTAPTAKREKVDFLIGDALAVEPYLLVQATVDMSAQKTRKREIESLEVAMGKTGTAEGLILALREQSTVRCEHGIIRIEPAWKWALEA